MRTWSPGLVRYFLSGGSLDRSAVLIGFAARIVSISLIAVRRALNLSICSGDLLFGQGREGSTPKTSKDQTRPFGPIVSLIALTIRCSGCSSSTDGCSARKMLKIRAMVWWYLSNCPIAF